METRTPGSRTSKKTWIALALVFVAGLSLGALFLGGGGRDRESGHEHAAAAETIWTCSMHPQVQLPEPGQCPICFMDLIPVEAGGDESPVRLAMSREALKLAEVATAPVSRQVVEADIRTVGKVAVDERRLRRITAWVPGRLDRLYVDYTGVPVQEGDHLVEIYSPELYSTQAELIEALRARRDLEASQTPFIVETAEATVNAAREKLRLLGLKPEQIEAIESRTQPSQHVTIYAPISGIVVHKAAVEGDYVQTGSSIYTIAELSQVWVLLDAYESDLVWVHYGQSVSFEVEAFPGETFEGRIVFIDPTVDPATRTVKVRVNAANPRLRLKPDMFVRATIRSAVVGDGRTLAPDLAGKRICPMHPEIMKDHAGTCDICGMALVPASELGLVTNGSRVDRPLTIPATAPLITGKRAVVYVRVPGVEKPTFEGREVVLGPRAGDRYIVESGLTEGEEVVVKGNFKIDSAMQIQAKPSMMSPQGGAPAPAHDHGALQGLEAGLAQAAAGLQARLPSIYEAYFSLHAALAGDDAGGAGKAALALAEAIRAVDHRGLSGTTGEACRKWVEIAAATAGSVSTRTDIAAMRKVLPQLIDVLLLLERTAGPPPGESHLLIFCPMAFNNQGAWWLQKDPTVRNPYFGASMLTCGTVKETFGPASGR